jgi:integrase
VDRWFPYQLRHSAATRVRSLYQNIEAAQVFLRHKHANVTEVYADRDLELYRRIVREIG